MDDIKFAFPDGIPKKVTMCVPNRDTHVDAYTIIPKEVLQKAYLDKKGSTLNFNGNKMNVADVRITSNFICVDLERDPEWEG